jgi:hypothetical protein
MRHDDDDPGLPIKLGPCSNGEYVPRPLTPVVQEAIRRARDDCDDNARHTGMSRRRFLLSACGAATTLLALNACNTEEARRRRRTPGGTYEIPVTATTDPDAARAAPESPHSVYPALGCSRPPTMPALLASFWTHGPVASQPSPRSLRPATLAPSDSNWPG